MQTTDLDSFRRLRRNRLFPGIRNLIQETQLTPYDIVYPLFCLEGKNNQKEIPSLPGIHLKTIDLHLRDIEQYHKKGLQGIALFPFVPKEKRSLYGEEAYAPHNLIFQAIQKIKTEFPDLCLFADIALDPYTTHGHDGIMNENGQIDNDGTVAILIKQALSYAEAGVDFVAPSDMMDGRIQKIRQALDQAGYPYIGILSYSAKYASSFYGPFRDALGTSLSFGDKKTYQINPANRQEALLESLIDEEEGADILMIKPASFYLDVLTKLKEQTHLPICAYQVSGEYALLLTGAKEGLFDLKVAVYESLLAIKRAGAQFIFTYALKELPWFY